MKRRSAFTLLELLLAVAVIAVLATVIVGATSLTRQQADATRCMANLRRTNFALTQYIADHNGELLPSSTWDTHASYSIQGGLHRGLRDYLGIKTELYNVSASSVKQQFMYDTVLTCPALQRMQPSVMVLNRCYSANSFLYMKDHSSAYADLPLNQKPPNKDAPLKIANVEDPSKMWTFTDASGLKNSPGYAGSFSSIAYAEHLKYPHNQRNHFVFLSGHVEGLTREEFEQRALDRRFWGRLQ